MRTFALGPWLIGRWRALYWSVADESFAQQRAQSLAGAGAAALGAVGLAGGLGFAAWALLTGRLQAGEFAAMLLALQAVQGAMGEVTHALGQYVGGLVLKIADLFVYLDLGPEEAAGGAVPEGAGIGEIRLEGVSFRYPQRAALALHAIDLTLRPGERVALVGANGAGKTTLVKVLTGLYRPTQGRVLYGGRDLATLDMQAVRDRQAAVFQDHVRYAFTLSDNVGYGRVERVGDREAVEAAAARGGADAVAASLGQGYDTLLTREFTGGTDLSGGQWQRVAVSRGFMRVGGGEGRPSRGGSAGVAPAGGGGGATPGTHLAGATGGGAAGERRAAVAAGAAGAAGGERGGERGMDPPGPEPHLAADGAGRVQGLPLVVLDEPTAALDPQAEADVFRRFADMAGECTALLVSHRLGFARLCDRVLVLSAGGLIEQGTHEALLAAGGAYAEMWATQSQWYR